MMAIALTKLIYWLKHVKDKRQITELAVCDKLEEFRRQGEGYLGQSFAPIAAYGAHGAIVHYEPDGKSNIPLDNKSFLLLGYRRTVSGWHNGCDKNHCPWSIKLRGEEALYCRITRKSESFGCKI